MIRVPIFREQILYNYYETYNDQHEAKCIHYSKAILLSQRNKNSRAIDLMKSLVKKNPKNDMYRHLYANILSYKDSSLQKQIDHQRQIAYQLNPKSLLNTLLYAQSLSSEPSTVNKSRKMLKRALKKSKCIDSDCSVRVARSHNSIINLSPSTIHLSLAYNYACNHPHNFRKSHNHILKSMNSDARGRIPLFHPLLMTKVMLLIGKYQSCLNYFEHVERQFEELLKIKNQNFEFECKKIHGHTLLNMEKYNDAIKLFTEAQRAAVTKEQLLECCTAFVLIYSHLEEFNTADKWFRQGKQIWNLDKNSEIWPQIGIDLFHAHGFLWYKKKLLENRKRNRQFSPKLEPLPCVHFEGNRFKDIMMTGIYNSLYLFVYGLHAQYNDNLLVEAIISYHVAIKEVPTAIMYWHSSIAFFDLGYYAMSLKLLERAYRMTPEIPTIAHGYALKRLSLVNIISKRCSNCGNDKQRFRACMGCCQVYYCNRKCQKQHWNKVHRNICNGKFGVIIKVITNNCL
eukprot:476368_1